MSPRRNRRLWTPGLRSCVGVGAGFGLAAASAACGGDDRAVPTGRAPGDGVVCSSCRIELRKVVTVGSSEPPGALTDQASVHAAADGRFYVYDGAVEPGRIMVFGTDGRYRTAFGRRGEGPGEYLHPSTVLSRGPDTLHVLDHRLHRVTTLTTADYEVVADAQLPGLAAVEAPVVLDDGRVALFGIVRLPDELAFDLTFFGDAWQGERTVEIAVETPGPAGLEGLRRVLAPARDGRLWAAATNRYAIELWDPDGRRVRTLVRDVEWFQPWSERISPWDSLPQPELVAIHRGGGGRLWTLLRVPAADWRPRPAVESDIPGHVRHVAADYHFVYDTVLEVWDAGSGTVLASLRSPLHFRGFLEGGLVHAAREDEVGNHYFDVWLPELIRR